MCLNIAKINTALEEKHETVLFGKSDYMREMVSRVFSQKKKNVGFPLVESLRSWQESAKVPLKLWLAPPCEVAANQEDPLKMALHHHPNVVKPCYTVRYSCRFPSLSADGWKHCASFQLWHFILGCHDFLRNNRHSIKKLDIFTVIPWKKTCFCTLSFCWASPFLPTAPMPVKHLIQLYFSKFIAHFKQWALYFNYRVYISRLTHLWLKKKVQIFCTNPCCSYLIWVEQDR